MSAHFTKVFLKAGLVAIGLIATAQVASGEQMTNEGIVPSGPLSEMARWNEPRDEFHLYSGADVELIRFKTSHLLSICDARADPAAIGDARHAYPLLVTFDGETATALHLTRSV